MIFYDDTDIISVFYFYNMIPMLFQIIERQSWSNGID